MEAERGDDPCRLEFQGMETEREDDPRRLEFQGMETERGDDLREAKRLKPSSATDAISFKSEEVPAAEMNVDVDRLECDPVPSSEMDVDVDVGSPQYDQDLDSESESEHSAALTALSEQYRSWYMAENLHQIKEAPASDEKCVSDESSSEDNFFYPTPPEILQYNNMLHLYRDLDRTLFFNAGHQVYRGSPETDKEYLFLSCELKGDPEKYRQVLSDMLNVMTWKYLYSVTKNRLFDSDDPSVPKSVVIAKRVIVENKLIIGLSEILDCFQDFYTEWGLQKKVFGYKVYEEFLLNFWEENKREPKPTEIKGKFCEGYFPKTCPDDTCPTLCSLVECLKPGEGKLCYPKLTHGVIKLRLAGVELLKGLQEGCSREEGLKIIEECYKKRLSEPCCCGAHYLKVKLEEVVKTGLDKKIKEQFPSYDDVVVRSENIDIKVPIKLFDLFLDRE